jgi:hypothetical protein
MSDDGRGTTYVSRRSLRDSAVGAVAPRVRAVAGRLPRPAERDPSRPRRTAPRVTRPYGVAAAVAAAWAVAMGLLVTVIPTLLVWAFTVRAGSSAEAAAFTGADLWLAAHHVPLSIDGAPLGLLPLGLLVVPFLLLRLSGTWATRMLAPADLGDAGLLVVATSAVYGLLGGLVAAVPGPGAADASPFVAAVWCAVVALCCMGWTVVRVGELGADVAAVLPGSFRRLLVPAAGAVLTLLGVSAVLVAVSLAVRLGDASALADELGAGVAGGLALLVIGVAYVPNVVVWAASFCVGPGFAVGTGTSATMAGVTTGPMPAFPLLAALPSSGTPAAVTWLCLLVPVAAGVVAGLLAVRHAPTELPETTALWAAACGAVAGLSLGVLAWLSGGPLGDGRLATVGPSPWQVGGAAALELALVAAVTAWTKAWSNDRADRADRTP